jgi:murein DD-endopeptidase MepM/ murein hydrolase activator NlpD
MRPLINFLKRYALFPPLLILMVVLVGGLVYLAGWLSVNRDAVRAVNTPVIVTSAPPPATPQSPLSPLNPAIMAYLERNQPDSGPIQLEVVGKDVVPVGAYLPRTGNTRYELAGPTALPTPLAYPTSPTLPYPTSPPIPPTLTPVPSATVDLVATVLAFDAAVTPALLYNSGVCPPSGRPVEGILTQYFTGYHSGIDMGVPLGTPVLATQSGIVTWADWNTFGYGNLVIIQSERYITYYAHLTSFNVQLGENVFKGGLIAFSGSTGNSSGPHIHYETRIDDIPVDPMTFESRALGTC